MPYLLLSSHNMRKMSKTRLTITVNFLTHVKVSYPICQCTEI